MLNSAFSGVLVAKVGLLANDQSVATVMSDRHNAIPQLSQLTHTSVGSLETAGINSGDFVVAFDSREPGKKDTPSV